MRSLRVLFVVQGEGRGHMTQALAMQQLLQSAGHDLVHTIIVTNPGRSIPSYVRKKLESTLSEIEGPGFISDEEAKGVKLLSSAASGFRQSPRLLTKVKSLHDQIERHEPDLIVNFYDILTGIASKRYGFDCPIAAVGHQYLFEHPDFSYPGGRHVERLMFRAYTRSTALGSDLQLALSFYPLADRGNRLKVVPPLLRPELFDRPLGRSDRSLVVYLLNDGYVDEIIRWHENHPERPVHCFWDRGNDQANEEYDETLTFHALDDERFLDLMAACGGVATTAGFESVCEAKYLNKPAYMVPVPGHYEQYCNALDACRAGAGIRGSSFDLSPLVRLQDMQALSPEPFRAWVQQGSDLILPAIERLAESHDGERTNVYF